MATESKLFCVPSEKREVPPPVQTDHFQCYPTEHDPLDVTVVLRDQFDADKGEKVNVLAPFRFCNPTKKLHKDAVTPITNPWAS